MGDRLGRPQGAASFNSRQWGRDDRVQGGRGRGGGGEGEGEGEGEEEEEEEEAEAEAEAEASASTSPSSSFLLRKNPDFSCLYPSVCPLGGQECQEGVHHLRNVTGMDLICYLSLNSYSGQCSSSPIPVCICGGLGVIKELTT